MLENVENTGGTIVPTKNKLQNAKYRSDGCLQPSPSISLTDDHTIINLDGYHCSVADLKEHIIDSYMYRKHLKALIKETEGGRV